MQDNLRKHNHVEMHLIYLRMQHNYVDIQHNLSRMLLIIILHIDIFMLHVNIVFCLLTQFMLHVGGRSMSPKFSVVNLYKNESY